MKKILFILLFSLALAPLSAQLVAIAENQFVEENYKDALASYEQLLKQSPNSALYQYRYARCLQETGNYNTAIQYFRKAGEKYKLKYFHMGECYFQLNHMDEAIDAYQTYLDSQPDTERKDYILTQIKQAQKMQSFLRHVAQVTYLDSFDVSKDSILSVYQLSAEAGRLTQDSIYFGWINQFNNRWTYAMPIDSTHTTYLMNQYRLLNVWGDNDTLPERVNQYSQQNSPYWLSDGVTLYFSANNPDGLGGMDIYVTRYNTSTETFTIPENIGMPFNSSANDYLYVLDETKGVGYWATDRYSTPDSVRVYKFESKEPILWTAE